MEENHLFWSNDFPSPCEKKNSILIGDPIAVLDAPGVSSIDTAEVK